MVEPRKPVSTPAGSILAVVLCPRCADALDVRADLISCKRCGQRYPRLGRIPVLLRDPDTYIGIVCRQLRDLGDQIEQTAGAIDRQLRAADVLSLTRDRCRALLAASRQQHSDVAALLTPLVPSSTPEVAAYGGDRVASLLTNIHYLFRDWGWTASPDDENATAFAALIRMLGDRPAGRTLVLGAGACRLAYDLHRHAGATETMALDIDALLLAAASAVIRGHSVPLTEAYADINELARPATRWTLKAPEALADDRFHLVLADGLNPPFAAHAFDTVVTPWFIDAIPSDLRDAIGVVCRLLRPAGRWVSIGPLRYPPDVPIGRRFTREEVFDLAERAGLHIVAWEAQTSPSLASSQTGRGKLEWVMAFCALENSADGKHTPSDRPPAWLLFGHLPVPTFAGQSLLLLEDPLSRLVVSAIDGERTLDGVTERVISEIASSGLSRRQVREAVRQCLADVHPSCRE